MKSKGECEIELKCRFCQGKLITKYSSSGKVYYLDQIYGLIDRIPYWVSSSTMSRYLSTYYGISPQEYYNIVVYGEIHGDPKCYCGNYTNWLGKLSRGYSEFCCHSCARSYHISHPELYPEVAKQVDNFTSLGIEIYGPLALNSVDSNIRKARTQFLICGTLSDECVLYCTWLTDGRFKYGITCNLKARNEMSHMSGLGYVNPHILIKSNRLEIANIEAKIKYKFDGNEILDSSRVSEFFKELRSIISTRPVEF